MAQWFWSNGGGNKLFSNANNWDDGAFGTGNPAAGDDIFFGSDFTDDDCIIDINTPALLSCNDDGSGYLGTITLNAGKTFHVTGDFDFTSSLAIFNGGNSSSTITIGGNLIIGASTFNQVSSPVTIGGTISGNNFTQTANLSVTGIALFNGTYTLTSGTYSGASATFSCAAFVQNGGVFTQPAALFTCTVNFTLNNGTFTQSAKPVNIGGNYLQTNGTFTQGANIVVITGTYTVSGGTFTPNNAGIQYAYSVPSNPLAGIVTPQTAVAGPGTVVDDATVGTVAWSNPGNVGAEDGVFATVNLTNTQQSHYLKCTNYGFNLPASAIITGIGIRIKRKTSGQNMNDNAISLVVGGVIQTAFNFAVSTAASPFGWTTSNASVIYGGDGNLLQQNNLTVSDINNSGFGVAFSCNHPSVVGTLTASVDIIELTIYYVAGGLATAWTSPGTVVNDTNAVGLDYLTLPTPNAIGGVVGTQRNWTVPGTGTVASSSAGTGYTKFLLCNNFGFNIPANAIIYGILTTHKGSSTSGGGCVTLAVKFFRAAGQIIGKLYPRRVAANTGDGPNTTSWNLGGSLSHQTTNNYIYYGGNDYDNARISPNPALVNSANFGIGIAVSTNNATTNNLNDVKMKVIYYVPIPLSQQSYY